MKWVSSIRVLTGLSRHHHVREAHLLLGLGLPLHGLHMGMLHSLLIYQLLLRRCRMGRLSWIELVMPTGGERGSSSLGENVQDKRPKHIKCQGLWHLHDIVWRRSAMLMWLRLIGRMAPSSWQQVVLHRDWGCHVATLRNSGISCYATR